MKKLSDVRRLQHASDRAAKVEDARAREFIAFSAAISVLDCYCLRKTDDGVSLTAHKGLFRNEFAAKCECDMLRSLGDWLCSLPKAVW